ncbi:hypothetical protein Rsub_04702 [Raphidocelis subcapitata]|uniref:PLAT domain-containing protein n=1 Tax=Raphidocelis subcapitata TaxID=307507 RepID=A0A2V0NWG1_9CHLO|nr:hypothetical protein Rsub_04702 [Raphidocelis subcapitata]|eukprot:GBF91978.1 hypothetical protein Rsub_04702 [Raphidocelis subcapitata]
MRGRARSAVSPWLGAGAAPPLLPTTPGGRASAIYTSPNQPEVGEAQPPGALLQQLLGEGEKRLLPRLQRRIDSAVAAAAADAARGRGEAGGAAAGAAAEAAAAAEARAATALRRAEAAERSVGSLRSDIFDVIDGFDGRLRALEHARAAAQAASRAEAAEHEAALAEARGAADAAQASTAALRRQLDQLAARVAEHGARHDGPASRQRRTVEESEAAAAAAAAVAELTLRLQQTAAEANRRLEALSDQLGGIRAAADAHAGRLAALEASAAAAHGPSGARPTGQALQPAAAQAPARPPASARPQGEAAMAAFTALLGAGAGFEGPAMAASLSEATPRARAPHAPVWQQPSEEGDEEDAAAAPSARDGGGALAAALEARLEALEREARRLAEAAPVDTLTAGMLEARVSILEDDFWERQRQAEEGDKAEAAPRRSQLPAEPMRAVDEFGQQLDAVLQRFATGGGGAATIGGAPAGAGSAAVTAAQPPAAALADLQGLAARVAALESEAEALAEAVMRATASSAEAGAAAGAAGVEAAATAASEAKQAAVDAAGAAEAAAAAGAGVEGRLQERVESLAEQLFTQRVEWQNAVSDAANSVQALRENVEIWQASKAAAAERAEAIAREALDRATELAAAAAEAAQSTPAPAAAAEQLADARAAAAKAQAAADGARELAEAARADAGAARGAADEARGSFDAVRADAAASRVEAESLRTRLEQLAARVGELASQLAKAQQQRGVSEAGAAAAAENAAAAAAATAELTLRLQASAAESERRLASLAEQVAAVRAAAEAQTARIDALEAEAQLASGVEEAIGRLRGVRDTLEPRAKRRAVAPPGAGGMPAAQVAGSGGSKAVPLAAGVATAVEQLHALTQQLAAGRGAAAAHGPQTALPAELGSEAAPLSPFSRVSDASADSLESPLVSAAGGGTVSYAPPGGSLPPSHSRSAVTPLAFNLENSLFGMESDDGGDDEGRGGEVGGLGFPVNSRINALFEDAAVEGQEAGGEGRVRPTQQDSELPGGGSGQAAAASGGETVAGGDAGAAAKGADPPSAEAAKAPEAASGAPSEHAVSPGAASAPPTAAAAQQEGPAPVAPGQPEEHAAQHATMPPKAAALQGMSPLGAGLPRLKLKHPGAPGATDGAVSPGSGGERTAAARGSSLEATGTGRGRSSSTARGHGAAAPRGGPGRGAARRRGRSPPGRGGESPPSDSAGVASPQLRHAEAEAKGPSAADLAKKELERAASESPGRVRRTAAAFQGVVAAVALDGDTGSPAGHPQGQGQHPSAGRGVAAPLRRPAVASSSRPAPGEQAAKSPDAGAHRQQPVVVAAAAPAGGASPRPDPAREAAERAPSPLDPLGADVSDDDDSEEAASASGLLDDDDGDFLLLPGLDAADPPTAAARRSGEPPLAAAAAPRPQQLGRQEAAGPSPALGAAGGAGDVEGDAVLRLRGGASAGDEDSGDWDYSYPRQQRGLPSADVTSDAGALQLGLSGTSGTSCGAAAAPGGALLPAAQRGPADARLKRRLLGSGGGSSSDAAAGSGKGQQLIAAAAEAAFASSPKAGAAARAQQPVGGVAGAASGWRVVVCTSGRRGAGTDALATLALTARGGGTMEVQLNAQRGTFADGSCLEFSLEPSSSSGGSAGGSSGVVEAAVLWHDGEGYASAWLVDRVVVQDMGTGAWWSFSAGSWIRGGRASARQLVLSDRGVGTPGAADGSSADAGVAHADVAEPPPAKVCGAADPNEAVEHSAQPVKQHDQRQQQKAEPKQSEAAAAAPPVPVGGQQPLLQPPPPLPQRQQQQRQRQHEEEVEEIEQGQQQEPESPKPLADAPRPGDPEPPPPRTQQPLDEVELELRGSPRSARARSRSRSPTSSGSGVCAGGGAGPGPAAAAAAPSRLAGGSGAGDALCETAPPAPPAPATRRLSGSLIPAVVRLVPLPTVSSDGICADAAPAPAAQQQRALPEPPPTRQQAPPPPAPSPRAAASGRAVHFGQYAERLEFEERGGGGGGADGGGEGSGSGASSVMSFTEEQLLDAQGGGGVTTYAPPAAAGGAGPLGGYSAVFDAAAAAAPAQADLKAGGAAKRPDAPPERSEACAAAARPDEDGDCGFEAVPLSAAAAAALAAAPVAEYRLRVFTADRLSAGLPGGQSVHVEISGDEGALTQQLPRPRGAFARGRVDAFTLRAARLGRVTALTVWSEPDGPALGGGWACEAIELEDRHKGKTYRFPNTAGGGWLFRGRRNELTLLPEVGRLDDDREALLLRADELRRQLSANAALDEAERRLIAGQLEEAQARLAEGAARPAASDAAGRGRAATPPAAGVRGDGSGKGRRPTPR